MNVTPAPTPAPAPGPRLPTESGKALLGVLADGQKIRAIESSHLGGMTRAYLVTSDNDTSDSRTVPLAVYRRLLLDGHIVEDRVWYSSPAGANVDHWFTRTHEYSLSTLGYLALGRPMPPPPAGYMGDPTPEPDRARVWVVLVNGVVEEMAAYREAIERNFYPERFYGGTHLTEADARRAGRECARARVAVAQATVEAHTRRLVELGEE